MKQLKRFSTVNSLVAVLLIVAFALMSFDRFHAVAMRDTEDDLERCLLTFRELLRHKGAGFSLVDGKLLAGSYVINGDFEVPDKVHEIFGETATIFMGDTRVSTNVLREDGTRAVGTKLEGAAYDAVFRQGKSFRGETRILGIPYYTAYDPIRDGKGKVIGALYVGMKKSEFLAHYSVLKVELVLMLLALLTLFAVYRYLFNQVAKKAETERETDHRFLQTLMDTIPIPVYYKDVQGRYLGGNRAFVELTGVPVERLIGKTVFDISSQGWADEVHKTEQELLLKQDLLVDETQIMFADGTSRDVIVYKTSFPAADGLPGGLIGTVLDISERKRTEEKLCESERYLSDIIQFLPDATVVIDRAGKVVAWNRAMEGLSGVMAAEMLGKGEYEYALPFYGERRPILIDLVVQPSAETLGKYPRTEWRGNTLFGEAYIRNRRGERIFMQGTATALHDSRGEITGAIESIRDITNTKRAVEELRTLSCGIEQNPASIVITDREGRIEYVNSKFTQLTGYTSAEAIGQNPRILKSDQTPAEVYRQLWETILSGREWRGEWCDRKKNGDLYWESASISPVFDTEGIITRFIAVKEDITDRRRMEEELVRKNVILTTQQETSIDGILVVDDNGFIISCNRRFAEMLAIPSELVEAGDGAPVFQWVTSRMADPEAFMARVRFLYEHREEKSRDEIVLNDGRVFDRYSAPMIGGDGKYSGRVWYFRDITAQKRAVEKIHRLNEELESKVEERTAQLLEVQEELVRKEKLAVLGQLSGSVGHELRNPLGVMSNAIYFLKMVHADADATTKEYLEIIKQEIDNSQRIITDLLDFARTRLPHTERVSVRELLDKSLMNSAIPENVGLHVELPDSLPPLLGDPLQIRQVMQNLIVNAVQAMPGGGALRVAARRVCYRDEQIVGQGSGNQLATEFVAISVEDTGEGISPENMKKIFQPLFTTKARGIGLGLVICRNLVEANGGRIELESLPGEGTVFTVTLPVGDVERRQPLWALHEAAMASSAEA